MGQGTSSLRVLEQRPKSYINIFAVFKVRSEPFFFAQFFHKSFDTIKKDLIHASTIAQTKSFINTLAVNGSFFAVNGNSRPQAAFNNVSFVTKYFPSHSNDTVPSFLIT